MVSCVINCHQLKIRLHFVFGPIVIKKIYLIDKMGCFSLPSSTLFKTVTNLHGKTRLNYNLVRLSIRLIKLRLINVLTQLPNQHVLLTLCLDIILFQTQ